MKVSDLIREFCEIHSDKYSVYENYSGRFMFGAKCMGIIVRQGNSFIVYCKSKIQKVAAPFCR